MKTALLVFCVLSTLIVAKSQGTISGHVQDDRIGEELAGAHVMLMGTMMGTIADEHGNFVLKNISPGNYTAQVTFIGYQNISLPVEVTDHSAAVLAVQMVPGEIQLADVTIRASADQSVNTLSQLDIRLRPTKTSQDILRMVPGLFIAQHAGGGKAEQIFLRGFDVDHGTDVNLEVDGLPVNMVSHAHGQGYSDLHFVIPEIINYVDFNKGPYFADKGDFTTAGYVDFQTKNSLAKNFVTLEGGQFGTGRGVVGINLAPHRSRTNAYVAAEFVRTDGYFKSPQNFNRLNIMSKISTRINRNDKLTLGATFFTSQWNASGQVPTRAVESGMISRFGSIDDTEGGETTRSNLYLKYLHEFPNGAYLQQQVYGVAYDFNLFSNFTFYKNDPVNGDQIQQQEGRWIYGYKGTYSTSGTLGGKDLKTELGAGFRLDDVNDIALSHTVKRQFLNDFKRGDLNEENANVYLNETLALTQDLSINAAVRLDYFNFQYTDKITTRTASVGKAIVCPKLNFNYQANTKTQLYLRTGMGFHSNDARVVVAQGGESILPRAYGVDLGINSKITEKMLLSAALWRLDLDEEFVYVGDEGIVEPSGKTKREGLDMSLRYEVATWLFVDTDMNLTRPRSKSEESKYIPLAPTLSSIGGITVRLKTGFNGSLRYRYLGDRPANDDKSIIADGYFLADALVNYTAPKFEISLSAENIFNVDWNEAQFDTESRLADEPEPVSEIHFTPGTPLFIKLKFSFFF